MVRVSSGKSMDGRARARTTVAAQALPSLDLQGACVVDERHHLQASTRQASSIVGSAYTTAATVAEPPTHHDHCRLGKRKRRLD